MYENFSAVLLVNFNVKLPKLFIHEHAYCWMIFAFSVTLRTEEICRLKTAIRLKVFKKQPNTENTTKWLVFKKCFTTKLVLTLFSTVCLWSLFHATFSEKPTILNRLCMFTKQ